jgi:hypothetical protein
MTLEEYFSTGPSFERPIFDAVLTHMKTLGEPFLEPVSVGMFVKRDGVGVLQLRPMTKWVALYLFAADDPRPSNLAQADRTGRIVFHVVSLRTPEEVDDN